MKNSKLTIDLKWRTGFTLAEVLITLGIIGVVAALTIPQLAAQYEKNNLYQQFRKSYSLLYGAVENLRNDYGGDFTGAFPTSDDLMFALTTKIKVDKTCTVAQDAQVCFLSNTGFKNLSGGPVSANFTNANNASMILSDGTRMVFYATYRYPNCDGVIYKKNNINIGCSMIGIDTNGLKGPNLFGRDILVVYLYKYGLIPDGVVGTDDYQAWCDPNNPASVNNGIGCAGRMMMAGSMNF